MINTHRIVPVMATDLLTLYGNILKIAGTSVVALQATSIGKFDVTATAAASTLLAAEPVETLDFNSGVSAATVYFIPALDFKGFTANGAAATVSGEVVADGSTLYTATLATGTVTVAKVGF